MGGERCTEKLCCHLPGEDITKNLDGEESSEDETGGAEAAETSSEGVARLPIITLSQARKAARDIPDFSFVLEKIATSRGGSTEAYDSMIW